MTTHHIPVPKRTVDTSTSDVYDFEVYAASLADQDEKEN